MTVYGSIEFATETAFNHLITEAKRLGLQLDPCMGLMYLPSQEVTRQFQEACRAVIANLGVPFPDPD